MTNEEWNCIKDLLPPELTGEKGRPRKVTVLGDKAYGSEKIRNYIAEHGATYTIPPQSNVTNPWDCDWWLYKERLLVECFFQKLNWFRRVAMRYDKKDSSYLAFVYLASIAILVKEYNPFDFIDKA